MSYKNRDPKSRGTQYLGGVRLESQMTMRSIQSINS